MARRAPPRIGNEEQMAENKRTRNVRSFEDLSPEEQLDRSLVGCLRIINRFEAGKRRLFIETLSARLTEQLKFLGEE